MQIATATHASLIKRNNDATDSFVSSRNIVLNSDAYVYIKDRDFSRTVALM